MGFAVALGCGLAAGLGEAAVRMWVPEPILPRFVIDAGYGVRDNDTSVDTTHSTPGEYRVSIHTNAAGLRGQRDYPVTKPTGTYRVALLGDSFAYGYGVEDGEVVSEVLATQLARSAPPGLDVEVLNFGVAGFGQAEETLTYIHKVRAYAPDLVIIFYFDNDIGNDAVSELYRLDEAGTLVRTGNSYLPGVKAREMLYSFAPVRWLFEHSQLWNLVRNKASAIVQGRLLAGQGMQQFDDRTGPALALHRTVFTQLIDTIRADGAGVGVVVIPIKNMKSNFSFTREELGESTEFLLLGQEFLTVEDYYARDGHWRPSGHRKAAAVIEASILTLPLFAPMDAQ